MYCTAFDHAQVSQPATEKALENEKWVDESINEHKDCVPASTVYPI